MEDFQEKQHEATPKKLEDLKRKGQVLRSKEFTSAIMIIAGILMLVTTGPWIATTLSSDFHTAFKRIALAASDNDIISDLLLTLAVNTILSLLPIFLVVYVAVILSVFMFGGWNVSMQSVHFKLERLNPIKNLSNIYSKKMIIELFRSLFKVSIFISLLYIFIKSNLHDFFILYNHQTSQAIIDFVSLVERYSVLCILAVIVIASIDILYSYFTHKEKSKMSTQEVKDEHKEVEGNPEVKKKMKQFQLSLLRNNIHQAMKTADVVIVNPTHYSVALSYNDKSDRAPKVVAKGKGELAAYIRAQASQNSVPIYDEPQLARAIYRTSKVGQEINGSLYMAVAIVLSYVHQLKLYQQGAGEEPIRQYDLQIPAELHFPD